MQYFSLIIKKIPGKGRGVFTTITIPEGAIIEVAPVIEMSSADRVHLDQTLLHDYIFEWHPDGQAMCCMALGYVPIYNHSNQANAEYLMDYAAKTISIVAMRTIQPFTEICINYNGDWDNNDPLWFQPK
jgi:SET domain-containing protein